MKIITFQVSSEDAAKMISVLEEKRAGLIEEIGKLDDQIKAIREEMRSGGEGSVKKERRTKGETEEIILNYFRGLPPGTTRAIREIERDCSLPYTSTHSALQSLLNRSAVLVEANKWRLPA